MAQVTITINSREYAIACDAGEEVHIMQLARILEEKAKLLTASGSCINENMLLAMIGLLLADELSELKRNISAGAKPQQTTPEKPAEEYDFSELDSEIASHIEKYAERMNLLAKKIEML